MADSEFDNQDKRTEEPQQEESGVLDVAGDIVDGVTESLDVIGSILELFD